MRALRIQAIRAPDRPESTRLPVQPTGTVNVAQPPTRSIRIVDHAPQLVPRGAVAAPAADATAAQPPTRPYQTGNHAAQLAVSGKNAAAARATPSVAAPAADAASVQPPPRSNQTGNYAVQQSPTGEPAAARQPQPGPAASNVAARWCLLILAAAAAATAQPLRLQFAPNDAPTSVTLPVPEASRDLRKFAAIRFPFRSDSAIRWDLTFRNAKGESATFRVHPIPGIKGTASIPVRNLATEYLGHKAHRAYWISGSQRLSDISDVREITVSMTPNRPVTLDVGPFEFAATDAGDAAEFTEPLVDEFGQWIPGEWTGKVHTVEELRAAWKADDEALAAAPPVMQRRRLMAPFRATGYFRTEQAGGRWWFVDPDGQPFFSVGLDCVRMAEPTNVRDREKLFTKAPPNGDFYAANVAARHGAANTFGAWRTAQEHRLESWGFNTVGNWSDGRMADRAVLPYVTSVAVGAKLGRWHGYPDAFAPEFAEAAASDARTLTSRFRGDAKLIGYFIGNEPHWQTRGLIATVLADPAGSATKAHIQSVLAERGDSPETRAALLEALARKYFEVVCGAIRKADPNHLILGIRWAGGAPDPVLKANDVFDVVSLNIYRFEPPRDQIERIATLTKRPVLIGEFHFGAPERGYAPSLVPVRDQTQRGAAYRYYVERAAAIPAVVGVHYFQFADQPVTGRYDGENYNIGFVNQLDLPYPELVNAAKATHLRVFDLHAGRELPIRVPPLVR